MNMPPLPAAEPSSAEPLFADPPSAEPVSAAPPPAPDPREILKTLYARFPVFRAGEPLAIGIDKAVRAEFPDLPGKSLRIALAIHTHSNRYLRNMAKAEQRLDLQGSPAGEITDGQRQYAAERLQERLKKQAAKKTAANATPPTAPVAPTLPASPATAPLPSTPPASPAPPARQRRRERARTPASSPSSSSPNSAAPRPPKAAAASPRRKAEPPRQTLEDDAPLPLSLAEKLALLSEKFSRK
ncbi:MAG: ProQ/FinO family protein [Zoogloeaceae bacterium]|nr:ProQ/FinO family protein [Zoogloeaceae bacterium]